MSRYLHIAPSPVLFERARAVEHFDSSLRGLVAEMYALMYESRGVGLAAPQTGELLRVAVIDLQGRVMRSESDSPTDERATNDESEFEEFFATGTTDSAESDLIIDDCREAQEPFALVNPEIIWRGDDFRKHEEGCLSFPDILVMVDRPRSVEVSYYDIEGHAHCVRASGLLSICLQHELDHLDGRTIIDSLSRLRRSMVMRRFAKQARLAGTDFR